jgi:DNA-binding transcriptional ArsR family regulator
MYGDVSFVLSSPLSRKILESLKTRSPMTPLQLSKETNIARSNISTKLTALKKRGLVECVNPESRKWRFYQITERGKKVLAEVGTIKR